MFCDTPNRYDLNIIQNQTFHLPVSLFNDDGITPINITSWSFTGSIKSNTADATPIVFFTTNIVNTLSGSFQLYLDADTTWLLNRPKYIYDVIANNAAASPVETLRILTGKVTMELGVTEP